MVTIDAQRGSMNGARVRVATLNAFGLREGWAARRKVMASGFADLLPDLVALQEVIATPEYDQVRDVLGEGYDVVHHSEREADGQGISFASRWPVTAVHEVDLHLGPRPAGFACSALVVEIDVPACSDHGPTLDVTASRRLFDEPAGGVWASDHFGVTADLSALTSNGRPVP